MKTTILRSILAGVLILTAATPSVAADRSDRPDANGTRGTAVRVRMLDTLFRPRVTEVARGTRVKWVNAGALTHTTTALNDTWDSGTIAPGDSWSRVFRRAGTFRYHCTIHAGMTGRVVVT